MQIRTVLSSGLLLAPLLVLGACSTEPDTTSGDGADLDGDGVSDDLGRATGPYDIDGDGEIDGIGIDTNGDGKPDGIGIDTDGDGVLDAIDTDGDGTPDGPGPSSGGAAGVGGSGTGSGGLAGCSLTNPALTVTRVETTSIAALGTPFPTDDEDLVGPASWATQYGKSPEIVAVPGDDEVAILFQNQADPLRAAVVTLDVSGASATVAAAYEVESLGRILGFARDPDGNYFVASAVDEDEIVDATYPPNDVHRTNVVRVVKFDAEGCVTMESDVDLERGETDPESEIIVNPLVAATGRLAYGNGQLALVHGHNTEPDAGIGGTRHQKAITTHLSATDGSVTRTSTMWVSHSFDERLSFDGTGFVELHLGDAYPRAVTLGRYVAEEGAGGYRLFQPKGPTGANNTHTRLGGLVPSGDATYGQLALFATERSTNAGDGIQGTRDLALVRVASNVFEQDEEAVVVETGGAVSTQVVSASGEEVTNHVRWLTDLGENRHAERPRIVALGDGTFIVLWEQWTVSGDDESYDGTFALKIDAEGSVLEEATEISDHHLSRGDDAVAVGGRALYVTGTPEAGLRLNFIDEDLTSTSIVVP